MRRCQCSCYIICEKIRELDLLISNETAILKCSFRWSPVKCDFVSMTHRIVVLFIIEDSVAFNFLLRKQTPFDLLFPVYVLFIRQFYVDFYLFSVILSAHLISDKVWDVSNYRSNNAIWTAVSVFVSLGKCVFVEFIYKTHLNEWMGRKHAKWC